MPPSTSGNRAGRPSRPIPKAPGAELPDAVVPRIADHRRVPRACANTACRFSIGAWRGPRANPLDLRATSHPRPDRYDRAGRYRIRVARERAYRPLAMTSRAARQLGRGPKVVRLPQLSADFRLIIRSFPVHIENLVFRPENLLGTAMAIEAPLHQQRV